MVHKTRWLIAFVVLIGLVVTVGAGTALTLAQGRELVVSDAALHPAAAPAAPRILAPTPVGSGFVYQGQLNQAGVPVNAGMDFQFSLWDSDAAGNQIGSTQSVAAVAVTEGLFTVQLDFGSSAFVGDARWLEVAVAPTGSGVYSTLAPRQPLAPTPYALSLMPGAVISTTRGLWSVAVTGVTTYTNPLGASYGLKGVQGVASGISFPDSVGVLADGDNSGVLGLGTNFGTGGVSQSSNGWGTFGRADGALGRGVFGWALAPDGNGVYGQADGDVGVGAYGYAASITGTNYGTYGVTESPDGYGGYFVNNSTGVASFASGPGGVGLSTTGTKPAIVRTADGNRLLYAEEASEVWFADYGFGKLQSGKAVINIDRVFAQTINLNQPYHVFLQAYGPGELYVSKRTAKDFEVALLSGDPNVEFSYRLVAKRLGYEGQRLERAPWVVNPPAQPKAPSASPFSPNPSMSSGREPIRK